MRILSICGKCNMDVLSTSIFLDGLIINSLALASSPPFKFKKETGCHNINASGQLFFFPISWILQPHENRVKFTCTALSGWLAIFRRGKGRVLHAESCRREIKPPRSPSPGHPHQAGHHLTPLLLSKALCGKGFSASLWPAKQVPTVNSYLIYITHTAMQKLCHLKKSLHWKYQLCQCDPHKMAWCNLAFYVQ